MGKASRAVSPAASVTPVTVPSELGKQGGGGGAGEATPAGGGGGVSETLAHEEGRTLGEEEQEEVEGMTERTEGSHTVMMTVVYEGFYRSDVRHGLGSLVFLVSL